ncbi:MAG: right-handed parallel beta-helix repeat-containing protein, partial [Patescibacteria group bacterium]
ISDNVIASAYNGVFLNASTGMRVINNTVRNATLAAVSIYGTSYSNVSGNALTNATYAVFVRPTAANSYYNTIGNNTLGGTTTGIRLYDFSAYQVGYNNITGNVIENCSSYGVLLEARASSSNFMGYNRVAGNNISNCTNSVRMYAGDNGLAYNQFNVFENNVLRNAIYGVYLDVQDSRHTISYNNFTANIINATLYPLFMGDIYISPNSFSGNVFINENASNFIYNPGANATYSNVTFVRNTGSINFPESGILLTKSVNTSNTALGTDVASINSTALPELAIPANVTSYAPQCPAVIYYRTGFPLTSAQVISGGSVCTGPQCAPVSCANNSATFSVEDFSGYTANVTNCMVINASGTYTMAMNFSGAPYDASPFVGYACIKIASSDVAFDCQGYSITGTDNSTPTFGIAINGSSGTPLTNITIRNCPVSNFTYGIYGEYSDLVTIINATAYGHNETGIYLAYSSNASLANDTAYSNRRGFEVLASDSNVSNGTAYGNADHGFYSLGDVRYGSSAAYSNGGTGFRTEGSGAVIANCTAYLNAGRGIAIVGSSNATVTGCAAWSNSGDGFYEEYHGSSVLSDNTAFGNGGSGFNLTGGNGVVLSSNRMYNNTYDFRTGTGSFNMTSNLFLNPSGSLANYTNLSINDSVGSGESYYAVWSAIPAALPAGEGTFESKYLNITVMSGAPSIDSTVWHWLDSELANHTESRLALWKYNSSGWSNAGAQINAASNSLNVSNLNPASTYAILEQLCTVPTSDYLVNASTTFCPGTYYLNDTGSSGVIIANANSVNITCDGTVIVGNGAGIGIYLGYRSGVVLQGCTVSNYGTGILLYDSSSNTLNNNTIINSTRGVQLHSRWGTQSNIVQNNTISGGSSGVYFTSDANYPGDLSSNDVSYNAIRNSGAGIDIVPTYQLQSQAQFNAFRFNNITNCTRAISVAPASGYCDISYNTFSGNILRNGQYGVYFDEYYGRNWEVYRNNFTNNTMFNFSQYAAYFNNDETYGNHFACNNTLDGHMFCHYAYSANVVDSDLDLNASNDVTNLGIYSIVRSTNVTLANSTLRDDRHFGAFLWDNSGSRIMNVTMLDNGDTGDESNVYMNSEDNSLVSNSAMNGSSHGVIMFSSSGNRVNSSTVANSSAEAIYLYESSSNVINNDSVSGSGSASIRLHSRFGNANSNIIQNNTITGGAAGVRFTSDANYPGDLSNNDVSFNRISNSADGIHIFPTYEVQSQTQFNTFRSNNITNCTRAITLNTTTGYCDVSYNIFRDNILRDGQYGVYFDEYYSRNWEVYANNFTNNTMFNFSQYAAYFNNDETYGNHFACNNTLDGQMFCHYAYALNAAENGLSLNASNDVTNLGLFSIVRSTNVTLANSTLRDDRHFGAFLWDNSGSRIMNVTMLDNGDTGDESNVYM